MTQQTVNSRRVLIRSSIIMALVGVPFMVLLMYCAWLPVYLGMYFFIVGGLLLGGIWYRLAWEIRPATKRSVYTAGAAVLAFWVVVYLGAEYQVKPGHLAKTLADNSTLVVGVDSPVQRQQRYEQAYAHVKSVMREYGPGPIGYFVWNAVDGVMPPLPGYGGQKIALTQLQLFWIVRIVASVGLLGYGLHLQLKDLSKPLEAETSDSRIVG